MPYVGQKPADIIATAVDTTTGKFSGVVDADAGITVDNITIDGTTIALSSGTLTLDSASQMILDAAGGNHQLFINGTEYGRFFVSSGDFYVFNPTSDKDILFYGNDNGSNITALKLDMSADGHATFKNGVTLTDGNLVVASGHGIDFSAASGSAGGSASALLDDFEIGTFTPTIASGGFTNNSNTGEYTKVGNIVHIRMGFVCNSNASTSDVGGLPFPVTGSTAYSSFYPAIFMGDNATNAPITPNFKIGTSLVSFKQANGTAAHNINTTISTYRVVGFYYTTS